MDQFRSTRLVFTVAALFFASGCAALMYEVVWFHLLRLIVGASAISLGILLSTFMAGLGLGSIAFARVVSPRFHPLRVYAVAELGIAGFAACLPFVLPLLGRIYVDQLGDGSALWLRGFVAALCLLPPTILMGATLPAIGRWVRGDQVGVARLGFFYGANTLGAVAGSAASGFFLLRFYDVAATTGVAVALNIAAAIVALRLARRSEYVPEEIYETGKPAAARGVMLIYAATALSGAAALGAQVVWTRLLAILFGATVYTFSIILTVFLSGLGLGSALGARIARNAQRSASALGYAQTALIASTAWTAYIMSNHVSGWAPFVSKDSGAGAMLAADLMRCAVAILPATIAWGASFPLALAAIGSCSQESDRSRFVGRVYAANTLGAIFGAIAFTFWALPAIGSRDSQRWILALCAVGALSAFAFARQHATNGKGAGAAAAWYRRRRLWVQTAVVAVVSSLALSWLPAMPMDLLAGSRSVTTGRFVEYRYLAEGVHSSVVVWDHGKFSYLSVSGKVVASNNPPDMRLQRMLGHVPAMLHDAPRSVLIVGMGTGTTAGSFVVHPDVAKITICELEPAVLDAAGLYFSEANHGLLGDPRVRIVRDDARHFLATTDERFDVITSDPIHPWVRGAAVLYSQDNYELALQHLNPGGVIAQWVPLYDTNEEAVRVELATFFDTLPNGMLWSSTLGKKWGYDLVATSTQQSMEHALRNLERPVTDEVLASLQGGGISSQRDLIAGLSGNGDELAEWLMDTPRNHDYDLRLEYIAGIAAREQAGTAILGAIMSNRRPR